MNRNRRALFLTTALFAALTVSTSCDSPPKEAPGVYSDINFGPAEESKVSEVRFDAPSRALSAPAPEVATRDRRENMKMLEIIAPSEQSQRAADFAARPSSEPLDLRVLPTNFAVNPATKSAEDRFSTFAVDVDTASYTIARKRLEYGQLPQPEMVRVEEFVNYFTYSYPSPDAGAFGVHMEGAPSPFSADKHLLRIGVQGKRLSPAERIPVHLTFLVDVSGSMGAPDKLPLAKQSLALLTNSLREGDTVALATYAGRTEKILGPTGMKDRAKILAAIDKLGAGGGTAMSNGMEIAYEMAMSSFKKGHENRVLVISDGDANIGASSHTAIYKRVRHFVEEGITLSTIGVGMGNYSDTMMEQLANRGNGNYYYIDSFEEAQKVFESQVDGTLQVIAKDVKIQVEFDPAAIPEYRLVGYENRAIADEDFRNDRVDAGEIGAGHTVTALYEVRLNPGAEGTLATVRIRAKKPDGFEAAEQEFHLRDSDIAARVGDASADFQFATAVGMFAEVLRGSPYAKSIKLDLIKEVAQPAVGDRADRREFVALLDRAEAAFAKSTPKVMQSEVNF